MSVANKVEQFTKDSDLAHRIIHGARGESVATEGGEVPTYATALAQLQEVPERLNALEDAQRGGRIGRSSWAEALDKGPYPVDALIEIPLSLDAGSHVDPVKPGGQVVPNAGLFIQRAGGIEFLSADSLASKADRKAVDAMIHVFEAHADVRASLLFGDERWRSWVEVGADGQPTDYARDLMLPKLAPPLSLQVQQDIGYNVRSGDAETSLALCYADGYVALQLDRDGQPVADHPRVSLFPAVAWGDSTTYGADIADPWTDRWTRVLEKRIGKQIVNMGVSGERSDEIQFRAGSNAILATVVGGMVAASGTTTVTLDSTDPLRASTSEHQVVAICEDGTRIDGKLRASGSSRIFTRAFDGAAVATGKLRFVCSTGARLRGQLSFLGQGINDEPLILSGERSVEAVKGWYSAHVEALTPFKPTYVVWGLLDRGPSEGAGTEIGQYIRAVETWLFTRFGASFAPVRQFLASAYALDVAKRISASFAATADDVAAVAAGTVPASFRAAAGSVHLNPLGHQLQAWFLHQHLIARGIV